MLPARKHRLNSFHPFILISILLILNELCGNEDSKTKNSRCPRICHLLFDLNFMIDNLIYLSFIAQTKNSRTRRGAKEKIKIVHRDQTIHLGKVIFELWRSDLAYRNNHSSDEAGGRSGCEVIDSRPEYIPKKNIRNRNSKSAIPFQEKSSRRNPSVNHPKRNTNNVPIKVIKTRPIILNISLIIFEYIQNLFFGVKTRSGNYSLVTRSLLTNFYIRAKTIK